MARKLPWKRASESFSSSGTRSTAASTSGLPSSGPTARDEHRDIRQTPVAVARRHTRHVLDSVLKSRFLVDPIRSPSTSPPPERPREEFMIPGPLDDDKYRMVEDEFLHIAQRFTAHLHRAEYDRLKALAKAQNAATIREIERPIAAGAVLTATARQRSESAQRALKQRKALEGSGDGGGADGGGKAKGGETASPWLGTSLRGLMEAPRRDNRTIMPSATPATATPSRNLSHLQTRLYPPNTGLQAASSSTTTTSGGAVPRLDRKVDDPRSSAHDKAHDKDDDSDDDPFGLYERRMNRKKSREQFKRPGVKDEVKGESNKVDLSSIPSFL
ncbi:hypothetical protein Trco_003814 [Trichoderma cornu-damae]|uniref:Uncharacterized protein n=1 Tax=Trichoderma cornu-damae TaxID=654480 RepID=A0A9P8QLR8_9HYPO|nr:hypothetical protein Trco_003814 [Trichoderma cornu-damae]